MTNCEQKAEKYHQLQTRVSLLKTVFEANNYKARNKSDFDDFLKYVREILNIKKELKEIQNWNLVVELSDGTKLELGPTLGKMSWGDANKAIDELNQKLPKGEKPWRLPTVGEFGEIGKPIKEIWNGNLPLVERKKKMEEYTIFLGFQQDNYWTGATTLDDPDEAYNVYIIKESMITMRTLKVNSIAYARCVR